MFNFHGDPYLDILFEKLTEQKGACLGSGTLLRLHYFRVNKNNMGDYQDILKCMVVFRLFSYNNQMNLRVFFPKTCNLDPLPTIWQNILALRPNLI